MFCFIQPFLCTALLAPGGREAVRTTRQHPRSGYRFQLFVCWGVFCSGFVSGLFSVRSLYFRASLCIPDNSQLAFSGGPWSAAPLPALEAQQSPTSRSQTGQTSNSGRFTYLLSWRLRGDIAGCWKAFGMTVRVSSVPSMSFGKASAFTTSTV